MSKNKQINLLPIDPFSKTLLGRVVNWLLSTFRVIVVLVELVVMAAFLSRFWLDAKNSDISDEIKQRQVILASVAQTEKAMRETKQAIDIYNQVDKRNRNKIRVIEDLGSFTPPEVNLENIIIDGNKVSISGDALNENSVKQLSNNLSSKEEYLTQVAINNLQFVTEKGVFQFTITLQLK